MYICIHFRDMIYTMPIKTPEQMVYARQMGVKYTTFDSAYELKNLKDYWPEARYTISKYSIYNIVYFS